MPLPLWLGMVNLVVSNRLTGPFAAWLPGFAIVEHVGRRSGTVRRNPVNVFRHGDHYGFAMTYGPEPQWVKNVLAAGRCRIRTRGRWIRLVEPRRYRDPRRRDVPWFVRTLLGLLDVSEFLELRRA